MQKMVGMYMAFTCDKICNKIQMCSPDVLNDEIKCLYMSLCRDFDRRRVISNYLQLQ